MTQIRKEPKPYHDGHNNLIGIKNGVSPGNLIRVICVYQWYELIFDVALANC